MDKNDWKVRAREALVWITGILNELGTPYQIAGGLAAIIHGSRRDLNDIDIFLPSSGLDGLADSVQEHTVIGPGYHVGSHWRLSYLVLDYRGQQIELCNADDAEYLDVTEGRWVKRPIDFSRSEPASVWGVRVPVVPKRDLIEYKQRLRREVDLADLKYLSSGH